MYSGYRGIGVRGTDLKKPRASFKGTYPEILIVLIPSSGGVEGVPEFFVLGGKRI